MFTLFVQPRKWLHWFSADLCTSQIYVRIICPAVDIWLI